MNIVTIGAGGSLKKKVPKDFIKKHEIMKVGAETGVIRTKNVTSRCIENHKGEVDGN
jgi:hypothetical protein